MKLTITSITCNSTCSAAFADNLFLMIQSDAGVPARYPLKGSIDMSEKSSMALPSGGYSIEYDYGVIVTAWDDDGPIKSVDAPDYLFNIGVGPSSPIGSATVTKYNHNGAEYTYSTTISQ